jgi:hypothetical protein
LKPAQNVEKCAKAGSQIIVDLLSKIVAKVTRRATFALFYFYFFIFFSVLGSYSLLLAATLHISVTSL